MLLLILDAPLPREKPPPQLPTFHHPVPFSPANSHNLIVSAARNELHNCSSLQCVLANRHGQGPAEYGLRTPDYGQRTADNGHGYGPHPQLAFVARQTRFFVSGSGNVFVFH